MSLYDDIDLDSKSSDTKSDVSGWSVGHKLLHSHSKSKKYAVGSSTSSSKRRQNSALAPVVDLNSGGGSGGGGGSYGGGGGGISSHDGEIRFNHITGKMEAGPMPRSYTQLGVKTYPAGSPFADMSMEYDPGFPNEYADFSRKLKKLRNQEREKEEQEKENERRKESEERLRKREEERKEKLEKIAASFKPPSNLYNEEPKQTESTKRLALYDSSSDSDEDEKSKYKNKGSMEFAPPPSLLEESKPMTPPPFSGSYNAAMEEGEAAPGFKIEGKGGSVASKIMAKMGYRHGSGLGREEQGMSRALQVEKTSRRGGKILHEKDIASKEMAAAGGPVKCDTGVPHAELLRNPSKVLLLTNMVGPGEVDNDLEPETAEECSKYGKVIKCVIYELQNVPDDLAVRIFVEFDKISFAIKAAIDLNGRYFGGRIVRAKFYSHEKFLQMKLDENPL